MKVWGIFKRIICCFNIAKFFQLLLLWVNYLTDVTPTAVPTVAHLHVWQILPTRDSVGLHLTSKINVYTHV